MNTPSFDETPGGQGTAFSNEHAAQILNMLITAPRSSLWSAVNPGGNSCFEDALLDKLQTLTEQLAPLRELQAQLAPLEPRVVSELAALRAALARPDWSHATRLERQPPASRTAFVAGTAGVQQTP